ncbi:MAG: hypothetical protein SGI73_13565 [Chloroflexota bacterium]|nr:hypothetical protein [Chloroflexota bacterium]
MVRVLFFAAALCLLGITHAAAQTPIPRLCPPTGVQSAASGYAPGGIILTHFDRSALWLYNVETGARYPLPDTLPCARNCRLSPDARSLAYFNDSLNAFSQMRLNGTERALLSTDAADVVWWADGTLFVWTPGHAGFLLRADGTRQTVDTREVVSVGANGVWGVREHANGDIFMREMVNLLTGEVGTTLGVDRAYFNALAWSPDGSQLAFVFPLVIDPNSGILGGEIGLAAPTISPRQITDLTSTYGAVRINGVAVGELSWSPDSTRIAFWVTELLGANVQADLGQATIHIIDVNTRQITAYCGYGTTEHTPNPSRLVWSPDGGYLAFAGVIANDLESGYHLLALDTTTGIFTSLSRGVVPAFGSPDVVAWGIAP